MQRFLISFLLGSLELLLQVPLPLSLLYDPLLLEDFLQVEEGNDDLLLLRGGQVPERTWRLRADHGRRARLQRALGQHVEVQLVGNFLVRTQTFIRFLYYLAWQGDWCCGKFGTIELGRQLSCGYVFVAG